MKRTVIAMAVVLGFAASANAASLSVITDKATYAPGETINLTVRAVTSGDSASPNIVVELQYDQTLVSPNCPGGGIVDCEVSIDTLTSFNGNGAWSPGGGQGNCDSGPNLRCRAFDQIAFNSTLAPDDGTWDAVFTFTATGFGVAAFDFNPAQFFGIGGPAPGSFVAGSTVTIVPEPTTMALLGLGVAGLAVGGRRRRR